MLLRQRRLVTAICIAAFLAAVGLTPRAITPTARGADPAPPDSGAQEALTPAELAGLEAMSSSFRKLTRLARAGVVQIEVRGGEDPEPDPAALARLRRLNRVLLGNTLSEEQIQKMARQKPPASGSGIIFDDQGHILTNNHVVRDREEMEVRLADDRTYDARLVGLDAKTDVAVIKIDAPDLHPLTFANSDQAEVGDWVLAIGAPFGLAQTITHGIISATGRTRIQGFDEIYYQNFLQTDAAINPGNSGGPLLNMRGEVLGINTAIASEDDRNARNAGVAFAIPSNMAVRVARALIDKGVVARGWLGVSFVPGGMTPADVEILGLPHDRGVLVSSVLANSPARKAGVLVDDYITAVNGHDISGAEQFVNIIGDFQPDEQLRLQVLRDGQAREFTVKLAEQPDDPTDRLLKAGAEIGRPVPQLGVSGRALRPNTVREYEADDRGVLVTDVEQDGPCAKAVNPGEVITAVNDHKIRNLAEMEAALKGASSQPESATTAGPRKIRIDILQPDGDQRLEKVTPR